jgi:hypothetical protein
VLARRALLPSLGAVATAAVGGGLRVRAGAGFPLVSGQRWLPGGEQAAALGHAALARDHRREERGRGHRRRARHGHQVRLREVQGQAVRLRGRSHLRDDGGHVLRHRRGCRNRGRLDGPAAEPGMPGAVEDGDHLPELGDGLVGDLSEGLQLRSLLVRRRGLRRQGRHQLLQAAEAGGRRLLDGELVVRAARGVAAHEVHGHGRRSFACLCPRRSWLVVWEIGGWEMEVRMEPVAGFIGGNG